MEIVPAKIAAAYWTHPTRAVVLLTQDFAPEQAMEAFFGDSVQPSAVGAGANAAFGGRKTAHGLTVTAPAATTAANAANANTTAAAAGTGVATDGADESLPALPPLKLFSPNLVMRNLRRVNPAVFATLTGYYRRGDAMVFCVDPARYRYLRLEQDRLCLAASFNDWGGCDEARWRLSPRHRGDGSVVWELAIACEQLRELAAGQPVYFKFRTAGGEWLPPCGLAPNLADDGRGNINYRLDFERTGSHVFAFDVEGGRTFVGEHVLVWAEPDFEQHITPEPGLGFFALKSELPLGAIVERAATATASSACAASGSSTASASSGSGFGATFSDSASSDSGSSATPGSNSSAAPASASSPARGATTAHDATTAHTGSDVFTVFRLFAPRATAVTLELRSTLAAGRLPVIVNMELAADLLTWEARVEGNLHGSYYHYRVCGEPGKFNAFNPEIPVLDPYALASVGANGPGIVVDRAQLPRHGGAARAYHMPRYEDLTIVEAHVRDITANAPVALSAGERRGFAGLTRYLESDACYLRTLGVNTVELQPCQQFDSETVEEYHWGYMTNNFFAPCSHYAQRPELAAGEGSAVGDFAALVAAFHRHRLGVVLDVVYNHVGEPPYLGLIDKYYYFLLDQESGEYINHSGTGNTLRAWAAMSRRLIIDSLRHWIETFDIDGMRFDLAELIGIDVLHEVETELRRVKPSLVFIAEPWSFRGNMQRELRHSTYAFWNDGYREFLTRYIRNAEGSPEGLAYFMKGSVDHAAAWPSQSVNYVASHDDMCWPDKITENPGADATEATATDALRTRLMAAVLLGSVGIPMLAQGVDFLQSKRGVNNTYQRGDLNALDYTRAERFADTAAYVRGWLAFRRGEWGRLWRLRQTPGKGYLRLFPATDGGACALLFNADRALGRKRLLFAINPADHEALIALPENIDLSQWRQFADQDVFHADGLAQTARLWSVVKDTDGTRQALLLPPQSCCLWGREG